jgi:hypothetical protein
MLAVCVLTRRFNGGSDSLESSPNVTLSRGAFSASSLVTPTRRLLPGIVWFPFATVICDLSLPPPPHTASGHARRQESVRTEENQGEITSVR